MAEVRLYDALAADYDRFVNWEGRLAYELPFFERLLDEHLPSGQGKARLLDAACGTGQHAIALAQQGYEVLGADLSTAMAEGARANAAAASVPVRFVVAGFGHLAELGETFDGVLCLGNSLPHLLTAEALAQALADFAAVLRPGGLLLLQNRNFDRVWRQRERFMGPQSYQGQDGEWLFVRFYDFHQQTLTFNMIRLQRTEDGWAQDVESTELRPLFHDDLAATLRAAGFGSLSFYGGCDDSPFDPAQSNDLIALARKG